MKKIIFLFLIFFFLTLIQYNFFCHFSINNSNPNLILFFVFFVSFFEKKESNIGLIFSFFGGITIDIFSSYFFGIFTLLIFGFSLLIKLLKLIFEADRFLSFILIWLAGLIFYYSFSAITGYLYYHSFDFDIFGFLYTYFFGLLIYFLRLLFYAPIKENTK